LCVPVCVSPYRWCPCEGGPDGEAQEGTGGPLLLDMGDTPDSTRHRLSSHKRHLDCVPVTKCL